MPAGSAGITALTPSMKNATTKPKTSTRTSAAGSQRRSRICRSCATRCGTLLRLKVPTRVIAWRSRGELRWRAGSKAHTPSTSPSAAGTQRRSRICPTRATRRDTRRSRGGEASDASELPRRRASPRGFRRLGIASTTRVAAGRSGLGRAAIVVQVQLREGVRQRNRRLGHGEGHDYALHVRRRAARGSF